ncbi:MAG: serine/threonine-protein kinase, partial [Myxococcota bacterium]
MSGLVPPPPPAGLLAGRYRLLDPVGSGGMSTVYRAWDEQRQVFRAVKILERRVADNPRVRQRLLDEAHIMARLQHEHVVTLYEAGADGQRLYLVMELMTGGSVQDRLADGPIPPRMAVGVIAGVLSALQLAHDNGVVHRDVKPHNILLDAQGVPKVTDFGIARLQDGGLTRTGMVLGTLAYMPPEQKLSARKVDPRADLYSTGATLYAMVTGREPHDLYAAGLDAQIGDELFDGVPAELAGLIRQATAFRPEDRYASAQVMAAALAAAAARLPPDPPSRPLVSLERLAESRAAARLGPTLLGVT